MRSAETCLTGIAFLTGMAASLGAVLNDPDLVYTFNWAHAKFEFGGIADMSMYAGFQAFCVKTEMSGYTFRSCQSWEDLELAFDSIVKCDGSAPPPPAPPPCADNPILGGQSSTHTNLITGGIQPFCEYWSQCCPDGIGAGQHPTHAGIIITSCGSTTWMATYCPITCQAGCGLTHVASNFAGTHVDSNFADVLCTNMDMSMLNTILWYAGIGCMLIKFLIQRCIIVTVDRRRPKAIADSVLSFLSTALLAVVLFIYSSSCYPGEAFEDIFLMGGWRWGPLSAAQV